MELFLLLHLVGAGVLFGSLLLAGIKKIRNQNFDQIKLAKFLAVLTLLQAISGAGLAVSTNADAVSFCSRIGLYVAVVAVAEFALLKNQLIRRESVLSYIRVSAVLTAVVTLGTTVVLV